MKMPKKTFSNISIPSVKSKESEALYLTSLKRTFFWALKWNTIEAIGYQILFLLHQSLLFYVLPSATYGAISTITGLSFASMIIITGALDTTLMTWITEFTQDKASYRHCWYRYLLPQALLFMAVPVVVKILCLTSFLPTFLAVTPTIAPMVDLVTKHALSIGMFIGIEGCRKLLRHLAQLMFMNKQVSLLELLHLGMYCLSVWALYFLVPTLTINHLLIPFIVTSGVMIFALMYLLYCSYQELPELLSTPRVLPSTDQVWFTRGLLFINQILRTLFSSNILVPCAAAMIGFSQASYLAYLNYVLYTLTFFMYKICIPAAAALFGHVTHSTIASQRRAFMMASFPTLIIMGAIGLATGVFGIWSYYTCLLPLITLLCLCILGVSHVIEIIYTLYEKFFIIRQQLLLLTLINIGHLATAYGLMCILKNLFPVFVLSGMLRVATIGALSYLLMR